MAVMLAGGCGPEIVKPGSHRALSNSTTTLPADAGRPGREALNCSSAYFDGRALSSSEPLGLPVQFPGAPDGSELCGVDTRTGAVAYAAPIDERLVALYYASALHTAGCAAENDTSGAARSDDIVIRWTCGSRRGRIVIAADAGAYDVIPDTH